MKTETGKLRQISGDAIKLAFKAEI